MARLVAKQIIIKENIDPTCTDQWPRGGRVFIQFIYEDRRDLIVALRHSND